MANSNGVSRRTFIKAAATASVAAPYVINSGVLAAPGRKGPNDCINVALIGAGGQGNHDLREVMKSPDVAVVAVCDVWKERRDRTIAWVKKDTAANATQPEGTRSRCRTDPEGYNDFREVLARKDVDAVIIASPPHWHAVMATMAADAGKDFYLEKPMTLYPAESLAIMRAVRKNKTISQIGTQMHSTPNYARLVDVVRSGVLGKISVGRCFHVFNDGKEGVGHHPATQVPQGLDWDLWMGPGAKVPFHPKLAESSYFHPSWWYSGGWTPGMAPHVIDLPFWALELDAPLVTSSSGGRYLVDDDGDCYDFHEAVWQFPNFTLTWTSSQINSYGFDLQGKPGCYRRRGIYLQGVNGTLIGDYEYLRVVRENCFMKEFKLDDVPRIIPESPGHYIDWVQCIRSRQQPACHVGYHYKIDLAITLSLLSLKLGRSVRYDPAKDQIVGDPEAQKMAVPEYRAPWKLPAEYLA